MQEENRSTREKSLDWKPNGLTALGKNRYANLLYYTDKNWITLKIERIKDMENAENFSVWL